MRVFVLTETDSTDSTWTWTEVFSDHKKASEKMQEMYNDEVELRKEDGIKFTAEIGEDTAKVEVGEDITIAWSIKDCDVK